MEETNFEEEREQKKKTLGKRENNRKVWRVVPTDWKFNELEQRERGFRTKEED